MNRFSAACFLVRLCTSLIVRGDFISVIALICSGLALIPRWLTINPMNFSEHTLNAHIFGLSFIMYLLSNSKVSSKCSMCSIGSLDFVIISSTYTSIVHLIYGPCIFQTKWHFSVTKQTHVSNKCSALLFLLIHMYLIVSGEYVY